MAVKVMLLRLILLKGWDYKMTVHDMLDEIFSNLKEEIKCDNAQEDKLNETLLKNKISAAYRDVVRTRRYPSTYSDAMIEKDMLKYQDVITDLARYDYSKMGAEQMDQYSSDGTSIHYTDRNKLFVGVYALT